jgi:hypothetical protein
MMGDGITIKTRYNSVLKKFIVGFYDEHDKLALMNCYMGDIVEVRDWELNHLGDSDSYDWIIEDGRGVLFLEFGEEIGSIDYKKEKARQLWEELQEIGFRAIWTKDIGFVNKRLKKT